MGGRSHAALPFWIRQLRRAPWRVGIAHAVGSPSDCMRKYFVYHRGPPLVVATHSEAWIEIGPVACFVRRECPGFLQEVEVRDRGDDQIGTRLPGAPLRGDLLIELGGLQPNELDLDVRKALVEFADPELGPIQSRCPVKDEAALAACLAFENGLAIRRRQSLQRLPDACIVAGRGLGNRCTIKQENRQECYEETHHSPRRHDPDPFRRFKSMGCCAHVRRGLGRTGASANPSRRHIPSGAPCERERRSGVRCATSSTRRDDAYPARRRTTSSSGSTTPARASVGSSTFRLNRTRRIRRRARGYVRRRSMAM